MTNAPDRPHLLVVAPSAYPLGGVATWLDYLVPGLERRGWRVTVGLVSGRHHDVDAYRETHAFEECLAIDAPTGTPEGRVRALAAALERVRPDLALSVNIPDLVRATHRLRRRGGSRAAIALSLHAIQPDLLDDLARWSAALDGVVVTNRLLLRIAERVAGVPSDRLHYAPYGVASRPRVEREQGRDGVLRVGYCGRLETFQKRVCDLAPMLEALERLDVPAELWISGAGPDESKLRSELSQALTTGRARFLGVLDPEELDRCFYREIDVLIVPSLWETGPIVAWEAMSVGVPVVASEYVGSGAEGSLVHGENCLLYPIGDVEAAARFLASLGDGALVSKLRRGGRALVERAYTLDRSVAHWDVALRAISSAARVRAAEPDALQPAGRLDRLAGPILAERVRAALGRTYEHSEPGGEWPHTFSSRPAEDREFWKAAKSLDRAGAVR